MHSNQRACPLQSAQSFSLSGDKLSATKNPTKKFKWVRKPNCWRLGSSPRASFFLKTNFYLIFFFFFNIYISVCKAGAPSFLGTWEDTLCLMALTTLLHPTLASNICGRRRGRKLLSNLPRGSRMLLWPVAEGKKGNVVTSLKLSSTTQDRSSGLYPPWCFHRWFHETDMKVPTLIKQLNVHVWFNRSTLFKLNCIQMLPIFNLEHYTVWISLVM